MSSKNKPQEQEIAVIAGRAIAGVVAGLVDAGVPASTAFRFAAIALVDNLGKPEVFEQLGLSRSTRYRYHAEIRRYFADRPDMLANPPADLAHLFDPPAKGTTS